MRPIWIISAIAVSITTSVSAQVVVQNTRQQIEQLVTTYRENWNNHNTAGIAGLYTKDGVLVSQIPKVVKTGTQEIAQQYELYLKQWLIMMEQQPKFHHLEPALFSPWVNTTLAARDKAAPPRSTGIGLRYVREGDAWKIRLLTAVPDLPPTPPAR
jgi:uncharacterized protein (TIGR02246 family)